MGMVRDTRQPQLEPEVVSLAVGAQGFPWGPENIEVNAGGAQNEQIHKT